jgi:DNA-directed RNA polymerase specialized sigma24 family protein
MANILEKFSCPLERYIFLEELKSVYDALLTLSPRDSDIFLMKYYDNYKIQEILEEHLLTRSQTETSLINSSKKIRKILISRGQLN